MVNKILACYQDMPSQRWRGQVWSSEVLSNEKAGLVTERSADRCNHGFGNQGHLRYSTGDSKQRHSPWQDINAGVAGCARKHQCTHVTGEVTKEEGVCSSSPNQMGSLDGGARAVGGWSVG